MRRAWPGGCRYKLKQGELVKTRSPTSSFTMSLKVVTLFLLLCAIIIIITEGAIPKCCVTTSKSIPGYILRKTERFDFQSRRGVCEIDSLILYAKGKKYCAHPMVKRRLKKIQKLNRNKKKVEK
ncbi:hypothetical protein MATL_G00063780 [Megalops atlanticus]|uniref:Chemokine interleukin-8-like domain-containing protein n=1 Tax=Megalops atlanticus TaxID=7932 RepID=A0A9D3QBX2_MEGAT|nr:hypothetical protein MATL_G00063780 [Megalops atlanticus]